MYEMIRRLYESGKLTEKGLAAAVARGWITQTQADNLSQSVK